MTPKPSGHISLFGLIFFVPKSLLEISRRSALDPIFTQGRTVFCLYITLRWYFKLEMFHPRRPRGSQSGRRKRWDESFQIRAKEPLGTDSHRTISKKFKLMPAPDWAQKMLCIIVRNRRTVSPEFFSWREVMEKSVVGFRIFLQFS